MKLLFRVFGTHVQIETNKLKDCYDDMIFIVWTDRKEKKLFSVLNSEGDWKAGSLSVFLSGLSFRCWQAESGLAMDRNRRPYQRNWRVADQKQDPSIYLFFLCRHPLLPPYDGIEWKGSNLNNMSAKAAEAQLRLISCTYCRPGMSSCSLHQLKRPYEWNCLFSPSLSWESGILVFLFAVPSLVMLSSNCIHVLIPCSA